MNNKNNQNNKEQLAENLTNAFELIDDDIIAQAATSKKVKRTLPFKKIISVAACFSVVAIGCFAGIRALWRNDAPQGADGKEEEAPFASEQDKDDNVPEGVISTWFDDDPEQNDMSRSDNQFDDAPDADDEVLNPEIGDKFENSDNSEEVQEQAPSGNASNLPALDKQIEIDDLNKLAYYSGWTILRKYGNYNVSQKEIIKYGLKPLKSDIYSDVNYALDSDISEEFIGFGTDVSESDISTGVEINPGWGEDVVVWAVYSLTVNSVEYFQIELYEGCFLTEQIGVGMVEVMILNVNFDNSHDEIMIVFKNGDNYFSCLKESQSQTQNNKKIYSFTASKYVSNFNIVKMPSLEGYTFTVTLGMDGETVSDISFENHDKMVSQSNYYVSMKTHNFANNLKLSNTASGLTEELYKIYLEEVVAGVTPPILPEKPKLPETSEDHESPSVDNTHKTESVFNGTYVGKGTFETETGHRVVSGGSENISFIKSNFSNNELSAFLDTIPSDISIALFWVKGNARHSQSSYEFVGGETVIFLEYVPFAGDADEYTVFVFELYNKSVSDVKFVESNYSSTLCAAFTTENEYDYISGGAYEDEYQINLCENGMYVLYKNGLEIYSNGYKYTEGYIVLISEDDAHYNEMSPVSTFVYRIEGRNRIFELMN